jgi:hypothetical protein
MKIKHLMEGAEPKLAGAPEGIQIMTPQQFVASAGDMPGEESEEGVAEGVRDLGYDAQSLIMKLRRDVEEKRLQPTPQAVLAAARELAGDMEFAPQLLVKQVLGQGVAEGSEKAEKYKAHLLKTAPRIMDFLAKTVKGWRPSEQEMLGAIDTAYTVMKHTGDVKQAGKAMMDELNTLHRMSQGQQGVAEDTLEEDEYDKMLRDLLKARPDLTKKYAKDVQKSKDIESGKELNKLVKKNPGVLKTYSDAVKRDKKLGVAEGLEQLNRIRKLSGLAEATTLPAQTRDLGSDEFQDYMKRIVGTPDVDKQGNVKTDKKGNEKYVSGKTKTDRYKMPYIHRSSVIEYLGPDGETYDEDKIKQSLAQRPKNLLKQNEKMKHSNGEFEQFFNVGFAALTGIALDEDTNKLIIVNTCPGAGSCKVDCFAMKGGKVQFKAAWLSDGRILTYLLNDPDGFFNQLSAEISKEEAAGQKGDKKFPKGWQTTIRWHDAGDFFSPEYLDMALKMAAKHPDTKFYAYTKMAAAALAQKPPNFIINWSEGANTSQEKQVKATDANLDTTKNSRIVPDEIFQDLLVKDEKKNLVKGEQGQWQVQPDKLPELKQRLAKEYGLSSNSILNYDEYMAKRKSIPAGMKYNVIVAPGEGDISANDPNIISTLLLKH